MTRLAWLSRIHPVTEAPAVFARPKRYGRRRMKGKGRMIGERSEGGMNFRNVRPKSDRRSLLTGMRRVVQWLKLELRLEALARPVGISDELDVDVWSRAEYLHFRSLVAEHGYCGRP